MSVIAKVNANTVSKSSFSYSTKVLNPLYASKSNSLKSSNVTYSFINFL